MKHVLLFGAVILTLSSCSLQKQTTNTAKTLDIYGSGVIQKPVITNLKVNPQKIQSSYSANTGKGVDYHKSQAIAQAMMENKADVILEPSYEITKTSSRISIITKGYAANYENFRQLTGADTSLLVDAGIIKYNDGPGETPVVQEEKKKTKGLGFLLALLLVGAAAGAVEGGL